MRFGIGTYAFAWSIGVLENMPENPMTVFQFLEEAKTLGADCVQIADNIPLDQFSPSELNQIKGKAEQLDLEIEVGVRGLLPYNINKYLELADFFNSPILRMVIYTHEYQPEIPGIIDLINSYLPAFRAKNVKLAIENHDRLKAANFLEIIKNTDEKQVGICLDSANSIGADEGFAEVVHQLLPYTINLHVKDYSIKRLSHNMGFSITGTPTGKGRLPVDWLIEELEKLGNCQSAILELWPAPENHIQETVAKERAWAEQSAKFLKAALKK
ncbi:MAG: sugar phosphate isomerase/epimerase [Flammeovirgaceae bacterium]|nr:sugar phosphate isomerase/epimerase [Flammeovirgaceae bacterium]